MDDLWAEASAEHDAFAREASLARMTAELEDVMPFLLAARSDGEYAHRVALAAASIEAIAARSGVTAAEVTERAGGMYRLYREALAEGQDPLGEVAPLLNGSGFGSGPERPVEHDEGPDFSGGYSEVPQGGPGGPDPGVTRPRPPMTGPVTQAAGSLRRQADASPQSAMTMPYMPMPPDTGTGSGSVDMGTPSPGAGGLSPSLPAGVNGMNPENDNTPITPPSIGQVTSSADPVRRKVLQVTAAVAASNPQLPRGECERVARMVVGRYIREADLTSSVMDNQPVEDPSQGGGSGGSGGDHEGLGGLVEKGLAWKGLSGLVSGGAADAAAVAL